MRITSPSGRSPNIPYKLLAQSPDISPVSIDSNVDLVNIPVLKSGEPAPFCILPISANASEPDNRCSPVSNRSSDLSSVASSLEDLGWIEDLEHAVKQGSMSTPQKDYWRLLLEQTLNLWTLGRLDDVQHNCELAMQSNDDIAFFIMLCFQTIDIAICFDDHVAAANMLNEWIKIAEQGTRLTDLDREGIGFLRQIVFRKDMEQELRACLGLPNPKPQKKLSELERRAILDNARHNVKGRARYTDCALDKLRHST